MLEKGHVIAGRYRVEALIGQGGMAQVYSAVDQKLERTVAIKLVKEELSKDEDILNRFKAESITTASINEPHVVTVYDMVDDGDLHGIVMELVEGITLKKYIEKKGRLSDRETIGTALQAAEGLREAHARHFVHSDVKPQNLIIARNGTVKVADFGIARITAGENEEAILGSVYYISPEQALGEQADERSDLYSLGLCMYEMITGELPFTGSTAEEIAKAHLEVVPVPPMVKNPSMSRSLNDVIVRATRREPEERYKNADEMIADLKKALLNPEGSFVRLYGTEDGQKQDTFEPEGEKNVPGNASQAQRPEAEEDEAQTGSKGRNGERSRWRRRFYNLAAFVMFLAAVLIILLYFGSEGLHRRRPPMPPEAPSVAVESVAESTDIGIQIDGDQLMPGIKGMEVDKAEELLSSMGARLMTAGTDYSDIYYQGLIISQNPAEGEILKSGSIVRVMISRGSMLSAVLQTLGDLNVENAEELLSEWNIEILPGTEIVHSDRPAGTIVSYKAFDDQDKELEAPKEGCRLKLTVSDGFDGASTVMMPKVTGMPIHEAETLLDSYEILINVVFPVLSDQPPGTVTVQSIPEGTVLSRGSSIDLELSVSPEAIETYEYVPSDSLKKASAVVADDELTSDHYYGSVDEICSVGVSTNPEEASERILVMVRLRQNNGESETFVTLEEPKYLNKGTKIPVSYRNIRGILGVETGEVQVINAETQELYGSYRVEFSPPY